MAVRRRGHCRAAQRLAVEVLIDDQNVVDRVGVAAVRRAKLMHDLERTALQAHDAQRGMIAHARGTSLVVRRLAAPTQHEGAHPIDGEHLAIGVATWAGPAIRTAIAGNVVAQPHRAIEQADGNAASGPIRVRLPVHLDAPHIRRKGEALLIAVPLSPRAAKRHAFLVELSTAGLSHRRKPIPFAVRLDARQCQHGRENCGFVLVISVAQELGRRSCSAHVVRARQAPQDLGPQL